MVVQEVVVMAAEGEEEGRRRAAVAAGPPRLSAEVVMAVALKTTVPTHAAHRRWPSTIPKSSFDVLRAAGRGLERSAGKATACSADPGGDLLLSVGLGEDTVPTTLATLPRLEQFLKPSLNRREHHVAL